MNLLSILNPERLATVILENVRSVKAILPTAKIISKKLYLKIPEVYVVSAGANSKTRELVRPSGVTFYIES
jgi:hypothetical protein